MKSRNIGLATISVLIIVSLACGQAATPTPAPVTPATAPSQPVAQPTPTSTPYISTATPRMINGYAELPKVQAVAWGLDCAPGNGARIPDDVCMVQVSIPEGSVVTKTPQQLKDFVERGVKQLPGLSFKIPRGVPCEEDGSTTGLAISPQSVGWPDDMVDILVERPSLQTSVRSGGVVFPGIKIAFLNPSLAARMGNFTMITWPTIREVPELAMFFQAGLARAYKNGGLAEAELLAIPVIVAGIAYIVLTPIPDPGDFVAGGLVLQSVRKLVELGAMH